MICCPKCNNKYSFLSRLKSVNYLVMECEECNSKYKMKHSKLFTFMNVFLIFVISPRLSSFLPESPFLISIIRNLAIVITASFIVSFILSYFAKYEEVDK